MQKTQLLQPIAAACRNRLHSAYDLAVHFGWEASSRYIYSFLLFTACPRSCRLSPVPENVTVFAKTGQFEIFLDARFPVLLLCSRFSRCWSGSILRLELGMMIYLEKCFFDLKFFRAPSSAQAGKSFSKAKRPENGRLGLFAFMGTGTMKGAILAEEIKPRVGYTYQGLADATGLSKRFWRMQVAEGKIPFVKFKQAVLILPADLEQFLASRRTKKEEAQNQVESFQVAA